MDGVWLQKLADYTIYGLAALAAWFMRLSHRVNKLENNQDERTRQLAEINSKIDGLSNSVETKFNMIISRLIDKS